MTGEGEQPLSRTCLLLGDEAVNRLKRSRVAVFGLGGVGGHAAEALCRTGVGALDLIDADRVAVSNLNRQIIATRSAIGRLKTEVMKERLLDIMPDVIIRDYPLFFLPGGEDAFPFEEYDYIVDAVDTVSAKLALAEVAFHKKIPLISSMGAANKTDPAAFEVADIYETSVCPLARVMRRELKKRNIPHLKVVYSREEPKTYPKEMQTPGQRLVGSVAFVPSVAGLIAAGEVIRNLIGDDQA